MHTSVHHPHRGAGVLSSAKGILLGALLVGCAVDAPSAYQPTSTSLQQKGIAYVSQTTEGDGSTRLLLADETQTPVGSVDLPSNLDGDASAVLDGVRWEKRGSGPDIRILKDGVPIVHPETDAELQTMSATLREVLAAVGVEAPAPAQADISDTPVGAALDHRTPTQYPGVGSGVEVASWHQCYWHQSTALESCPQPHCDTANNYYLREAYCTCALFWCTRTWECCGYW